MKNATICVHPVSVEQPFKGAVTAPIFSSTAYQYLDSEEMQYPGFYSTYNQQRTGSIMAKLERGKWGMVFSSGMAAISTALLSFVSPGEHVIFCKDLYGGTLRLMAELVARGVLCSYAGDTLESFEALIQPHTRVIYLETPANPLLQILPLRQIASLANTHGIITIVDNTFATPINQLPLEQGINISVHSGTKYLGGHNDLPFGVLVSDNEDHLDRILQIAKLYGGTIAPEQCYIIERSLKTLSLRVERQTDNARQLATFLEALPEIDAVYYPGLASHPGHEIARQQMIGFGGMLSFELKRPLPKITTFLRSLEIISPAISLGGVESLISAPAQTSHRYLSEAQRQLAGIRDNLLRLSAGIEHIDDLKDDLLQALSRS